MTTAHSCDYIFSISGTNSGLVLAVFQCD